MSFKVSCVFSDEGKIQIQALHIKSVTLAVSPSLFCLISSEMVLFPLVRSVVTDT